MDTNKQLAEISRIMADGYHFVNFRAMLDSMPNDMGKEKIEEIVKNFYKLCVFAEKL